MKNKLVLILVFLSELATFGGHICNHRLPDIKELVNGIQIDELPPHHREKRAASSNLRIHFDYQSSFTRARYSKIFITNIMEPSRDKLQSLLIPKAPTVGVLRVDRFCTNAMYEISSNGSKGCAFGCQTTSCLGVKVPDMYLKKCVEVYGNGTVNYSSTEGSGIANVDIVILVTFLPCESETALAYADSCFMESTLDRPILGVLNLCSNVIILNYISRTYIQTITHEIIHVLGFSVDKYAFFRYSNGTPIVPRNKYGWPDLGADPGGIYYNWNDQIIKQIPRKRASVSSSYTLNFSAFVLPNVLTAARNHFDCPTLEGVDLEDFGGSGSRLSHFDEYFLFNEMMTPQSSENLDALSNITLAFLQDTGWYTADFSKAENLDYGYKKGCLLPEQGCYTYMQSNKHNLDPFCNEVFKFGKTLNCASSRKYFYLCSIQKHRNVDPRFQYFHSLDGVDKENLSFYTGSSPFSEYCPTHLVMEDPSFVCISGINNDTDHKSFLIVPSYYGSDSLCFKNEMYDSYPSVFYGASCQKYHMNKYPDNLTIFVGEKSFNCPSKQIHSYNLSDGKKVIIRCPDDLRTLNDPRSSSSTRILYTNLFIILIFHSCFIF